MKEEFREIYLKYSEKIFRFLFWHVGSKIEADDLTSEVFYRAFKNWKKFDGKYIQAWLYRIARNLLTDYYRGKKTVSLEKASTVAFEPEFEEEIAKKENIVRIKSALQELPGNLKEVVILRFFENLSAAKVGEILSISEVNVRVLQFRALKKLKEILNNERFN